jgi:catechol 2,3-dioxygenase-like lactoylglutathione lyase family enzyme
MKSRLALVTLVVADYYEAIAWFVEKLGFAVTEDSRLGGGKRWVVVSPQGGGASMLLAKAADADQSAAIGRQTGGRVAFFLYTDDFKRDYAAMIAKGVRFLDIARRETYGTVAVFEDLYGNKWDLIEPTPKR